MKFKLTHNLVVASSLIAIAIVLTFALIGWRNERANQTDQLAAIQADLSDLSLAVEELGAGD